MTDNTEREALERLLSDLPDPGARADAILASDVWRNRQAHVEVLEPGGPES